MDEGGRVRTTVATRETSDPHRDLWWAHTGGGGGNFGIVARYWFRSPDAPSADPGMLLPHAPESITTFKAEWDWSEVDRTLFLQLLKNHGAWCERQSDANSSYASLWTLFGNPSSLGFATYGGRINIVPSVATASAQRSSILDMACTTGWLDPQEEAKNLAWVRAFYQDLFAETEGVPMQARPTMEHSSIIPTLTLETTP